MEDLQIGVKGIVMVGLRVRHWSAPGDRSGVTLLPAFMYIIVKTPAELIGKGGGLWSRYTSSRIGSVTD